MNIGDLFMEEELMENKLSQVWSCMHVKYVSFFLFLFVSSPTMKFREQNVAQGIVEVPDVIYELYITIK